MIEKPDPPSCTCAACVAACKRIPGMFTPTEALRAVRAGYAAWMMSIQVEEDWRGPSWECLAPLSVLPPSMLMTELGSGDGYMWSKHSRSCALYGIGRCVFLNEDDRCGIHTKGFKPIECRKALMCAGPGGQTDPLVRPMWNTFVGHKVVEIWQRELRRAQSAAA